MLQLQCSVDKPLASSLGPPEKLGKRPCKISRMCCVGPWDEATFKLHAISVKKNFKREMTKFDAVTRSTHTPLIITEAKGISFNLKIFTW